MRRLREKDARSLGEVARHCARRWRRSKENDHHRARAASDVALEAWLSRGDRRLGQVILRAWQLGAKFDAWGENDNLPFWRQAFSEIELDPDFYAYRERALDEILPWDHIHTGVTKAFLRRDLEWSKLGKTRKDCREQCYACGILDSFGAVRPISPLVYWGCP